MLKLNKLNRTIRPNKVAQYANDMRHGRWRLTHQGIAFYADGTLADGQHRLEAVVAAGITVRMMVTTGLPKHYMNNGHQIDTFSLLDGGATRKAYDALRLSGQKNAALVGAMASATMRAFAEEKKFWPSVAMVIEAVRVLSPSIDEIATLSTTGSVLCNLRSAGLAVISFYHTTAPQEAEDFLNEIQAVTGAKKSPSRALATWIKNHKATGGSDSLNETYVVASALWHELEGNSVEKLYGSIEALDWLMGTNEELVASIRGLSQ